MKGARITNHRHGDQARRETRLSLHHSIYRAFCLCDIVAVVRTKAYCVTSFALKTCRESKGGLLNLLSGKANGQKGFIPSYQSGRINGTRGTSESRKNNALFFLPGLSLLYSAFLLVCMCVACWAGYNAIPLV